MFRIGGVRLWLGLADAAEDADVAPLREIESLCGLTFGPDHTPQDRPVRLDRVSKVRQQRQCIRLASVGGELVGLDHDPVGHVSGAKHLDHQRKAGR